MFIWICKPQQYIIFLVLMGVSIWGTLEKSCTFVSRNLWCTIWRTTLTAFPATCQTWRRIIISFCILCFHQLQTTLHFDNTVRETERPKSNWQIGQYLTTNKSYMRTSSDYCMQVMQRQSRGLMDCQHIRRQKLFLLHDYQCQLKLIFQVFSMQKLQRTSPVSSEHHIYADCLVFVCN